MNIWNYIFLVILIILFFSCLIAMAQTFKMMSNNTELPIYFPI